EIPRGEQALSRMEGFYAEAGTIPVAGLDALIITGAEPLEADMRRERYWTALAQLIDWAGTGTVSTIFSCLAAHAAVLHLSNIARRKLSGKLSGVFTAQRAGDHPLATGMAPAVAVPHSRLNTLSEAELTAAGYRVLARLEDGDVDSFIRAVPGQSLLVFLQGHPEYSAETLGREYLRDTGRFLRGERENPPAIPENYFDRATEMALEAFAGSRQTDDLARYTKIVSGALPLQSWRGHTIKLFGNWLALIAAEKNRRLGQNRSQARKKLRA
ncbi:MAG TPA: homoserine O-succinyltransferase, partial [Rhizomicrobium sp.]|nr:homoserine O-succinyltransferase [Rhizomicrobium sp.]